ncbi:hypothetical protein BJY01DRAFT_257714 [Aspergillus pseudoustus]|uniref:Nuclear fusion protein KAR5 n=1 Tax=Aspergillus pseudoustus TaxID=1810923 RepID=A0ABR4JI12_9EURO
MTMLCKFTYIILCASLLTTLGLAATFDNEPLHDVEEDLDLISLLNIKRQRHDTIFTEAVELLKSAASSASCNRMAAGKLVTTCQSIGRTPDISVKPDTYNTLDYVRSLYAARLAICELTGAGTPIPSSCLSVNASPPQRKVFWPFSAKDHSADSETEHVSRNDLENCLQSLESRPQWWTSYSNSRQNAVVICQASRAEKEKEEILELYTTLFESSTKMNQGFEDALRMATQESARYRAFAEATDRLTNEILHDMEDSKSSFRSTLKSVSQGLETRLKSFLEAVSSSLGNLQTGVTRLEKDIQRSSNEVNSLRQSLQAVQNESLRRSDELVLTQKQNAVTSSKLALSLQSQLQSVSENEIARLSESVGSFGASLEMLFASMGGILERGESVSECLRSFESSLQSLSKQVDGLQTQTKISKAFIEQGASAAANLVVTIEEGSEKYQEIFGFFGWIFGPYSTWVMWLFSGLILLWILRELKFLSCLFRRPSLAPLATTPSTPTSVRNELSPAYFDLVA